MSLFLKRFFDILFSALGLLVLGPVFFFIALAIKRDSQGPIFFLGERIGYRNKPFRMIKFRTMYEQPEHSNGSPVTSDGDSRVTPYGKWLRETKLNELPQLINVLKGDMSIVGPRPEHPEIAAQWPAEIQEQILSVRPGITSPASVVYRDEERMLKGAGFMDDYLSKILPDKLRLDQLYVQNRSFLTDLDVLSMTIILILPRLRQHPVSEKSLYSGAFYQFFHRVLIWFVIDVVVTLFTVGLSGVVWRISTVINLGVLTYLIMALGIAVLISFINILLGLPKITWNRASPTYVIDLAVSVGITMLILWMVTRFWFTEPWIPFSLIWLIGIMTFVGLVVVRYGERLFTGIANRWLLFRAGAGSFAERILIVGAGELGELALWLLQRSAFSKVFGVVGMVDDDVHKQDLRVLGVNILGTTRDIPTIIEKFKIGMIIFAIANANQTERERILSICQATSARVVIIPDLVKVLERSINKIEIQENV